MRIRQLSDWDRFCVGDSDPIFSVVEKINQIGTRTVFVVDENSRFLGVISDSEIRRGILSGISFEKVCSSLVNKNPISVGLGSSWSEVHRLMGSKDITLIPVLDDMGVLISAWTNIVEKAEISNSVVIMAGGKGTRLLSLTSQTPKPLVEVRGQKLLERLLEQVAAEGFKNVVITVHHMADQIIEFVGNGSIWGLNVRFVYEEAPMGTAGSLGILDPPLTEPFIVTNSDLMSEVSFSQILDFHIQSGCEMTVAVRNYNLQHPFGVIDVQSGIISGIREKPVWSEFVSAGIYALNPMVADFVVWPQYLDMPELINRLTSEGQKVSAYPLYEKWRDIGTVPDYEAAQSEGVNPID